MSLVQLPPPLTKIVSGGQTGVDRAALDFALHYAIPCGGWCPKGRLAEDGSIDIRYPLQETESEDVAQRTEWNARDSDGTLVITTGETADGTILTLRVAMRYKKPLLVLDTSHGPNKATFSHWIKENSISVLNIAGPRESHKPGAVYHEADRLLRVLFNLLS